MIDEVVILNLPRSVDRKDYCIGKLMERGTPANKIRVWAAKDDRDYEKTRDVCEAASADGFSIFAELLESGVHNRRPIAIITQGWNNLRVLREYSQSDKTVVFLQDDWYFRESYDFGYINEIVRYGMSLDDDLKYISLWYGKDADGIPNNIPSEKLIFPEKLLARGFVGSCHDVAMVLTPSGAKVIMELWLTQFSLPLESLFLALATTSLPGFYTSVKHLVRCSGFPSTIFREDNQGSIRGIDTTRD